MKKILVTGGMGFIGSHFIRNVLNTHPDWFVVNLDKLTYAGNPKNLTDLDGHSRYEFVQGDICDDALIARIASRVGMIVNFAAETHVDRSIDAAEDFIETNVQGTRVLLDAARRFGHELFLHVSTDEVYGSIQEGSFSETSPLVPNSPYAASKAASDLMVLAYVKTYGIPAIITRACNNYGPYQFPEKVVPLFVTNLSEKKKVPLYGNGQNVREWIHVEDHCRALDLLIGSGVRGQIYNVGSREEISNNDLTKKILKFFGLGENWIERVQDRLGHDFRYSLNTSKIQKLGFVPKWNFEDGLKQTIDWYLRNEWWWQPLKKDAYTLK